MSSSRKINATKNYRLFNRSAENRVVNLKKHKKLEESLKKLGFLASYPIVCTRDKDGRLIVKDGQHRLVLAEKLGLTVHWVEETVEFDVAEINSTPKVWQVRDFCEKYAAQGLKSYAEGLEFSARHKMPIGAAFALLAGTTSFGNVQPDVIDGTYKVKDRAWAEAVAAIHGPLVALSAERHNAKLLEACMAVCRVDGFDGKRLLENAGRCRDKLKSYALRESYLEMLEEVYNFGRKHLVGIKAAATMALRERNATVAAKKRKSDAA